MAKMKKLDMAKLKTTLGKHAEGHSDFKERIKNAINDGEHKAAETAIKQLTKARDGLHKMIEHVESHLAKKRPKMDEMKTTQE